MQKYWKDIHTCGYPVEIDKGNPLRDPEFRIIAHRDAEFALIRHNDGRFFTVHDNTYPETPEITASEAKSFLTRCREGCVNQTTYYKAKIERAQDNLHAVERELSELDELLQTLAEVQVEPPSELEAFPEQEEYRSNSWTTPVRPRR